MMLAIVDDDDGVRVALARLLGGLGHDVRVFASAEEFEAQSLAVDCMIIDVRLPGLSGLELRERVLNRDTPIPVVLITGDSDRRARDVSCAMDIPSLTKPFDDVMLMTAIADALASVRPRGRHAS
jgi:FixJ family two-component response regulator